MPDRPNILLILADQLYSGALSAVGNPWVSTPHLDSLALGGARFCRAYCTAPVCGPARASLLTGRMPHALGVDYNHDPLSPAVPDLGHLIRRAGYDTAYVGKWGLKTQPGSPGFDFPPLPAGTRLRLGLESDDAIADTAAAYIREPRERPFLLAVGLTNPHDICYWVMNEDLGIPTEGALPPLPPNFGILADEPEFVQRCRARLHYGQEVSYTLKWDEARWRRYLYTYYRLVERVDASIGRILDALREAGHEEDTLVVLTSDHGEGVAAHHWVVKLVFYEEPAVIPLLLRWPRVIPAGWTDSQRLVSGLDLLPTLCAVAGATPPEGIEGRSLLSLLSSSDQTIHDYVISELQPDPEHRDLGGRMLVTPRCKYCAFSEGARPELLFDLAADPGETHNLATDPDHATALLEHRRLLREWMSAHGDPLALPTLQQG